MAKRHSLAEDIISGRPDISVVAGEAAEGVEAALPTRKPRPKRAPTPPLPERYETVPVRMKPSMRKALVREAVRRMEERGGGRLDSSEVVREALEYLLEER